MRIDKTVIICGCIGTVAGIVLQSAALTLSGGGHGILELSELFNGPLSLLLLLANFIVPFGETSWIVTSFLLISLLYCTYGVILASAKEKQKRLRVLVAIMIIHYVSAVPLMFIGLIVMDTNRWKILQSIQFLLAFVIGLLIFIGIQVMAFVFAKQGNDEKSSTLAAVEP